MRKGETHPPDSLTPLIPLVQSYQPMKRRVSRVISRFAPPNSEPYPSFHFVLMDCSIIVREIVLVCPPTYGAIYNPLKPSPSCARRSLSVQEPCAQQAIVLVFQNLVALARCSLKPLHVDDLNVAAAIINESSLL